MTDKPARILKAFPPNYTALAKQFPIRNRNVLFTYGDTIYNPAGFKIPPELLVHEYVHIGQQLDTSPELWWKMYVKDDQFRLGVEIPAHRAEAEWLHKNGRDWKHVADRLAGPLYGNLVAREYVVDLLGKFAY